MVLANPTAARYGLGIGGSLDVSSRVPAADRSVLCRLPQHRRPSTSACQPWQDEVLAGCKHLADEGLPSICWDVYLGRKEEPNLFTLTRKIRALAKQKDPESTFSGEASNNLELESEALDYTWNWVPSYVDYRAFTSVFPSPRLNVNVNHSVADASLAFMDNLFFNVMPRKTPYGVNGAGTIEQYPEFSKTLKQCADRRRQFLDYFTGGTLIGECLLAEDCPDAHVSSYVRPGKALLLILNKSDRRRGAVPVRSGRLDQVALGPLSSRLLRHGRPFAEDGRDGCAVERCHPRVGEKRDRRVRDHGEIGAPLATRRRDMFVLHSLPQSVSWAYTGVNPRAKQRRIP